VGQVAHRPKDGEHLVLLHQLAGHLKPLGGVVAVVLYFENDLTTADASLGLVDVLEVRLLRLRKDGIHGPEGAAEHRVLPEEDLGVGDARRRFLRGGRGRRRGGGRDASGGAGRFLLSTSTC